MYKLIMEHDADKPNPPKKRGRPKGIKNGSRPKKPIIRPITKQNRYPEDSQRGKKGTTGRPPRKFDIKIIENLCRIQCPIKEIEAVLNSDYNTLNKFCMGEIGKNFQTLHEEYKGVGRASLRRIQFQQAEKNPAMAIFLGKNWLSQTDRLEQSVESTSMVTQRTILELPDNGHRHKKDK
jgi:hypothetical protein